MRYDLIWEYRIKSKLESLHKSLVPLSDMWIFVTLIIVQLNEEWT